MARRVDTLRFDHPSGRLAVPVIAVCGAVDGPTVVVTANVHGDETVGTAAALDLAAWLEGRVRRGRVLLYPTLNPLGLREGTRTFGAAGPDLNRRFPGDSAGDAASRFVASVWADLCRRAPDVIVDLHADSTASIPYAILDRAVAHAGSERRAMDAALVRLAGATGLTVLHDVPDADYLRHGLDRSLTGVAVNRLGIPAVTIEAGPRGTLERTAVGVAVDAVRGVLAHLGVIGPFDVPVRRVAGGPWCRRAHPRVGRPGVFRPEVSPGGRFAAGERLGRVVSLSGDVQEDLRAPFDGIVVAWGDAAWVEPGVVVGTLASREER